MKRTTLIRSAFVIAIHCVAAAPPAARADILLIAEGGANAVGQYDAANGSTINANFITGVIAPGAMTLDNSGNLFVVSNGSKVLEYNASTGAAMPFANPIASGLSSSTGIAVDNSGHLFVTNGFNAVREYSVASGDLISDHFITGLNNPGALARDSAGNFYVSNDGSQKVSKYDASGVLINAFNLTGVSDQRGFALDANNDLFIGNSLNNGTEGEYDATTGAAVKANFIVSGRQAFGLALDGNDLFVTYNGSNVVSEYNATDGSTIKDNFITGILGPTGIAVESSQVSTAPGPDNLILLATGMMTLGAWRWRRSVLSHA